MSVRKLFLSAALVALVVGATPTRASADWLFTPFVGTAFGGRVNFGDFNDFEGDIESRVTFGGTLGWMWAACAVTTIVLVLVTKAALRERQYSAVMAATGLLYLAILTAFGTDLVARAVLAG